MTGHLGEDDLILLYYGERGAPADARHHLRECPDCAAEFQALSSALDRMAGDEVHVPPGLSSRVWARLQPGMPAPRIRRWPKPLAWMATAAAIALASFHLGRHTAPEPPPATAMETRERALVASLGHHLERSRMVLTEVSNAPIGADLSNERLEARDLLASNRLYRQTAAFAGRFEYQDLLDELEQALLEIAQETEPLPRASGENLMFRMKVIESKIDPQEGQL